MIHDGNFVNISGVAIAVAREQGVSKDQEVRTLFLERMDQIMDASGPGNDLTQLLESLKQDNFHLGLVTFMRQPRLMQRLSKWRLTDYFESIMTPEQFPEFKPSPQPYIKAVEELGLSPANCCAVGDEPVDMMGAKSARIRTIGVPQGFFSEDELRKAGADVIIQSLPQLSDVVRDWSP